MYSTNNTPPEWQLFNAIHYNNAGFAQNLLICGVSPNAVGSEGVPALVKACQKNDVTIVKLLLSSGAEIDSLVGGRTALMVAAREGFYDIVDLLLSSKPGADPNFQTSDNITALNLAVAANHLSIVKLLLNNGAHSDAKPCVSNTRATTTSDGDNETVEALNKRVVSKEDSSTVLNNEDTLTAVGRLAGNGVQGIFRMVGGFINGVTAPSQQAESPEVAKGVLKAPSDSEALSLLLDELNALAGLSNVKAEVKKHINLLRVQQMRLEKGLSVPEQSLHMVFSGNPGTGKTSIARLLAKIYKQMGILSKGQFVETDRTGLVAEYVGQTGPKVQSVVKKALGGVLFIDEAYTLTGNERNNDPYGQEAVDILIKLMEDHRGDLIVIVAGYTEPMERFVQSNPGLRSRFNKYLQFDDYTPVDLNSIFQSLAKQHDYKLTDDAREIVNVFFNHAYENRTKTFGNARLARNLFETVVSNHALRIGSLTDPTDDELVTIAAEDI